MRLGLQDRRLREDLACRKSIKFRSGISIDSVFYKSQKFGGYIDVDNGNNVIVLYFGVNKSNFRLIMWDTNFLEVIQEDEDIFYIKTKSQPNLEEKEFTYYTQVPYEIFNHQEDDELTKQLLPHFLVIKLKKTSDSSDPLLLFLGINNIPLSQGWYKNEKWDRKPNFSQILNHSTLAWQVRYCILVLLTNSLMKLEDLSLSNIEIFNSYPDCTLANFYYSSTQFDPSIYKINKRRCESSKIPIKRMFITPTTIVCLPPKDEIGNRVVRKYKGFSEYFIRVTFCDEKLRKKTWTGCKKVLERFRRMLDNLDFFGFELEFLGFSNSQIKSHSCWMTLKTPESLTEQIKEELGDFSGCKNVAKYSARLGLCFSETHSTIDVGSSNIVTIPDVERNGYVFSDGIGKISPEFFFSIRQILEVNPSEELCAVQIRLGGCKGVLVLSPEITTKIQIRPSMQKFESESTDLEVCNFSKYKQAYLNRQIVLLLHGLGVPEEVFLSLQGDFILETKNSYRNNPRNFISKIKPLSLSPELHELVTKFNDSTDNESIDYAYNKYISETISKVRIPARDSALLMGVLDEYKILLCNQVYIRISNNGVSHVVTGRVVIAKNPCLHPGDIKILEAVNEPELAHLVNVVVFSQKGARPLPNKCSGSDLDGDEYFVSWNQQLVPEAESESMEYEKADEIVQEVNAERVKDYFIGYMKSEVLGTVANLHLVHADLKGIFSTEAIALAKLHSRAVDYPKTGMQISIPNEYRVKEWPDFMEKSFGCSYESPGILGKLYRSAKMYIN